MRIASIIISTLAITTLARAQAPPMVAEVEKRGAGPINMVLIPGLACDWTVWEAFMERNGERYTMHAVTLSGFAGTPAPAAPAEGASWVDETADAIARLILDEGLDDAVVVGHSLGGHLAVKLAVERPEIVAKAVDVDGFVVAPGAPLDMAPAERAALIREEIVAPMRAAGGEAMKAQFTIVAPMMVRDADRAGAIANMVQRTDGDTMLRWFEELFLSDLREGMKTLRVPVLVLAARPDVAMMDPGMEVWRESVKDAKRVTLTEVHNARHFIMDDQPEAFDELVWEFVKD